MEGAKRNPMGKKNAHDMETGFMQCIYMYIDVYIYMYTMYIYIYIYFYIHIEFCVETPEDLTAIPIMGQGSRELWQPHGHGSEVRHGSFLK